MQMCSVKFRAPFPRSTMMLEKYIWNLSTDPSIPGFSFCKYQSLREDYDVEGESGNTNGQVGR